MKKTSDVRVSINHRFFQDFQPIPTEYQNGITLVNSYTIDLFRDNKCKTMENRCVRYFALVVQNIRLVITYLLVILVGTVGNVRCLVKLFFLKIRRGVLRKGYTVTLCQDWGQCTFAGAEPRSSTNSISFITDFPQFLLEPTQISILSRK